LGFVIDLFCSPGCEANVLRWEPSHVLDAFGGTDGKNFPGRGDVFLPVGDGDSTTIVDPLVQVDMNHCEDACVDPMLGADPPDLWRGTRPCSSSTLRR
jgi:hypothetical protein